MSVSWGKDQRDRAVKTNQSLFYVAVDGRSNKKGRLGKFTYSGCISDKGATELFLAAQKIVHKYKEKK